MAWASIVGSRSSLPMSYSARVSHCRDADGVEVAAQQQPAAALVAAAAQDDAGPAGCALEFLDAQSGASSPRGHEGGDPRLARPAGVKARIDRVDAHQGVEQIQDRHGWSATRASSRSKTVMILPC
jgi:hypothetical protein